MSASRKRKLSKTTETDNAKQRVQENTVAEDKDEVEFSGISNDTESAILFIKSELTAKNRVYVFPPLVFVHQIYDIIKSKTTVNRQIEVLRNDKKVVLIHLGNEETMRIVLLYEDLKNHVLDGRNSSEKLMCERFFDKVLSNTTDIGVSKLDLQVKYRFSEADIRTLVSIGLLILRETGIFWFSFPSAGVFMRKLLKGRQTLLQIIKKRKHREILEREFNKKKLEKSIGLPLPFLIHDLVGGKFVECLNSTSGRLLRFIG